ncbi:TIGR02757 family protein [Helicobacter sp. MIT 05-5294]|uniref:TIGR02757 family protein n=1 Tax=Helicobacter sp. MIT 05-5294 TaxID=1548150 RepID=UPI000A7AD7FD|nr:TIGR02757 family protein [Helicobacter sp. MIT 05-5294]
MESKCAQFAPKMLETPTSNPQVAIAQKLRIPKNPSKKFLYHLLEEQYYLFNTKDSINENLPDPLGVAREFPSDKVALFCALFAYGNVHSIVKFLQSCNLNALVNPKDCAISCTSKVYRFQNNAEIQWFFQTLLNLESLQEIFYQGYRCDSILGGIRSLQSTFYRKLDKPTQGLQFLLGLLDSTSPLKRWNLFLRWVVRKDSLDLGYWEGVKRSDLLLPLDTHTFRIARRLGLLKRKTYDFKAVLELSENLKRFDANDPIKYDFALYRIGQLGLIE